MFPGKIRFGTSRVWSRKSGGGLTLGLTLFLFVGIFSLLSVTFSAPVVAQAKCGERKAIATILVDRYAEKPVASGMTQGGGVVEVFAANDGSWTMIVTMPTGHACFMAAGEDWENLQALVRGTKI
mgnify:FL=1|jgi:hypothetical protein